MNTQWEKVKEIFDLALEQPVSSRPEFVKNICGADKDLLNEVESLLEVYDEPENLIEKNALKFNQADNQELNNKSISASPLLPIAPSQLMGDLDNIILTALRKEPERRYASVKDLNNDISKYLNGLPVSARPNTFKYRTSKFFQRNKISVIAASLILLAILSGGIISFAQYRQTQKEKAKVEEVKNFLEKMLLTAILARRGKAVIFRPLTICWSKQLNS